MSPPSDTTSDARWEPMTVTVTPVEPIVGYDAHPAHLDGPLAWCAYQDVLADGTVLAPMAADWALDFALPLATWARPAPTVGLDGRLLTADGDVWGWACSAAAYHVDRRTTVNVRRRPALDVWAAVTDVRKHHAGAGPWKARDTPHASIVAREITWHALGDPAAVEQLLGRHLRYLGRVTGHGHGRIASITVTSAEDRDAWQHRVLPDPAGQDHGIRAPYWHHSRQVPATLGRPHAPD